MATKSELNSTKAELNSTKTELNSPNVELISTIKEVTSDETEYELRKKRETIISWLEFIPVAAICTVSALYFGLTLKELIFGGAPPDFGTSINPILTLGGGLCPSNSTGIHGFSDPATAMERGTTKIVGLLLNLILWVSFIYRTSPIFTAVYDQERLIS